MAKANFEHRHDNPYKYETKQRKIRVTKQIKAERNKKTLVQFLFGWLIPDKTK